MVLQMFFFFFQAEDVIRDGTVTGVQTCALPICVWNKAGEAVKLIEAARRKGLDITADCYPYDAWASTITVLVPGRRHDDPTAVKKGLDDVGGGAHVLVTNCAAHRAFEGKTLAEIGRTNNQTEVEVYMQIVKDGGAGVVCKSMTEPDIR